VLLRRQEPCLNLAQEVLCISESQPSITQVVFLTQFGNVVLQLWNTALVIMFVKAGWNRKKLMLPLMGAEKQEAG
jgi:hypothetical protein